MSLISEAASIGVDLNDLTGDAIPDEPTPEWALRRAPRGHLKHPPPVVAAVIPPNARSHQLVDLIVYGANDDAIVYLNDFPVTPLQAVLNRPSIKKPLQKWQYLRYRGLRSKTLTIKLPAHKPGTVRVTVKNGIHGDRSKLAMLNYLPTISEDDLIATCRQVLNLDPIPSIPPPIIDPLPDPQPITGDDLDKAETKAKEEAVKDGMDVDETPAAAVAEAEETEGKSTEDKPRDSDGGRDPRNGSDSNGNNTDQTEGEEEEKKDENGVDREDVSKEDTVNGDDTSKGEKVVAKGADSQEPQANGDGPHPDAETNGNGTAHTNGHVTVGDEEETNGVDTKPNGRVTRQQANAKNNSVVGANGTQAGVKSEPIDAEGKSSSTQGNGTATATSTTQPAPEPYVDSDSDPELDINYEPPVEGKVSAALGYAAALGYNRLIKFILREGCGVDHRDHQGRTLLHRAAAAGQAKTVRLLLRWGADPRLVTAEGKTAVDIATDLKRDAVVTLLKDAEDARNGIPRHLAASNSQGRASKRTTPGTPSGRGTSGRQSRSRVTTRQNKPSARQSSRLATVTKPSFLDYIVGPAAARPRVPLENLDEDALIFSDSEEEPFKPEEPYKMEEAHRRQSNVCAFCHMAAGKSGDESVRGEMLGPFNDYWAHTNCLQWSSNILQPESNSLDYEPATVQAEIQRTATLMCNRCGIWGASATCAASRCSASYHYACALEDHTELRVEKNGERRILCVVHAPAEQGGEYENLLPEENIRKAELRAARARKAASSKDTRYPPAYYLSPRLTPSIETPTVATASHWRNSVPNASWRSSQYNPRGSFEEVDPSTFIGSLSDSDDVVIEVAVPAPLPPPVPRRRKSSVAASSAAPGGKGGDKPPAKRRRSSTREINPNWTCKHCGIGDANTPAHRPGPDGSSTLCNACGCYYKKHGNLPPDPDARRLQQQRRRASSMTSETS